MPNRMADGTIRHLLNFPVALVPDWIHQVLGKSERWSHQFNGTKEQRIHLHWPSTAKKATSDSPWWSDPAVVQEGFTVLANDIGQRNAGAWALLKVAPEKPETSRPVRPIGYDGAREWFAEVIRTGMYRLPGEEARVLVKGQFQREPSGKRGRRASPEEYQDAVALAVWLGTPNPESWITRDQSFAEQNDQLIKLANRRLTRLNTYHRWSCFDSQSDRSAAIASRLVDELAAFDDPEVKPWLTLVEKGDFASFTATVGHAFLKLRRDLERILVTLANRTAPLRRATWTWRPRTEGSAYGMLVRTESAARSPKIRGQRGLSMSRLEQLESLRRLFLRFNRALDREPGKRASFGFDDRGRESGEPCLELLEKITRMKEQRVNQTAHLILAQALGVRLKRHVLPESRRTACDIHGEYEKIPGREPVDFIVIEDLSRYLSNQGRSPSENSRLMRWAHRAVRDKLKMLAEEPFGIPVVEVVPAYSSRFYAITGQPGARLREAHELQVYEIQRLEKLAERKEHTERRRATAAREILNQFEKVAQLNQRRRSIGATLHTLYLPMTGGPLFLAARDGGPVQADTNASINLGWRAIAAPECIDIHRRVRAKKEKGTFRARLDNAREKAAFSSNPVIELRGGASKKLEASSSPNFFFEPDRLGWPDTDAFDRATLAGHQLVSGVALWWWVNQAIYSRCADLNRQRLAQWENDDDLPF